MFSDFKLDSIFPARVTVLQRCMLELVILFKTNSFKMLQRTLKEHLSRFWCVQISINIFKDQKCIFRCK